MKKLINTALYLSAIAGLTAIAPTAMGQMHDIDNPSGPYVGAGWGQFNLDVDNLGDVNNAIDSVVDSDDNAWKIFAGYRFNPYVAVEAAYIDFGRPGDRFETAGSDGDYEWHISGFAPYVIGTFPLGPVELFGKVGWYFYDSDIDIDLDLNTGPDVDSTHSSSDLLWGGGIGFTLFDHLHLRGEYEVIDIENADADALWLSAAWRF